MTSGKIRGKGDVTLVGKRQTKALKIDKCCLLRGEPNIRQKGFPISNGAKRFSCVETVAPKKKKNGT